MTTKEIIKILEKVKPYLKGSEESTMNDLLYRTPQQSLREEADKMDIKDSVINEFNLLLEELKKDL